MALPMKMFQYCSSRVCRSSLGIQRLSIQIQNIVATRGLCSKSDHSVLRTFDDSLMEHLVCPITKKPLRYDSETNELISDTINVAYPVVNGIPNLVPQDGRIIDKPKDSTE